MRVSWCEDCCDKQSNVINSKNRAAFYLKGSGAVAVTNSEVFQCFYCVYICKFPLIVELCFVIGGSGSNVQHGLSLW